MHIYNKREERIIIPLGVTVKIMSKYIQMLKTVPCTQSDLSVGHCRQHHHHHHHNNHQGHCCNT